VIRQYWKPVVVGLLSAIVGTLLTLGGVHVWHDHWSIHETAQKVQQLEASQAQVVAWINAVQKQQQGK
jgi:hypothetical protein